MRGPTRVGGCASSARGATSTTTPRRCSPSRGRCSPSAAARDRSTATSRTRAIGACCRCTGSTRSGSSSTRRSGAASAGGSRSCCGSAERPGGGAVISGADVSAVFPGRTRPLRSAFVVGAPRCGTTFLAKAMARHPQICFSKPKETYFFVREPAAARPDAMREFLRRHFHALEDSHAVVAEGSPSTLYDPALALRILALDPDARFVVSVRNPVEVAPSFHARMLYTTDEDVPDFATSWSLQEARARGEHIPRRCREPRMLQYRDVCRLAAPVEAFLVALGRERCHVVVFDDLAADPRKVYVALLEFLGLADDGRTAFARKNENRDVARPWLQTL